MAQAVRQRFDFADYVELEELSKVRHEYLDGMAWAMAEGSPEHARIAANVAIALGAQLASRRCAVFSSDLRVCPRHGPRHLSRRHRRLRAARSRPRRSKTAYHHEPERRGRGAQPFDGKPCVDIWRRTPEGWRAQRVEQGSVELTSLECRLSLPAVYADPLAG